MFLLAASLLLSLRDVQVTKELTEAYNRVRPSVVVLTFGKGKQAAGLVLDGRGLVLCHRNYLTSGDVVVTSSIGRSYMADLVANDPVSGTALLKARNWVEPTSSTLQFSNVSPAPGEAVYAVLPGQVIRAEFVGEAFGLTPENRRYIPLSELRFEHIGQSYGGAPLVNRSGQLIGFVSANLPNENASRGQLSKSVPASQFGATSQGFGPGTLAIAYATAPATLNRAIEAFRKGENTVRYPAIGVVCKDGFGGAEIVSARQGFPAAMAGLVSGDVILEISGKTVANQLDFARILWNSEIGYTHTLRVRSGSVEKTVSVVVAAD